MTCSVSRDSTNTQDRRLSNRGKTGSAGSAPTSSICWSAHPDLVAPVVVSEPGLSLQRISVGGRQDAVVSHAEWAPCCTCGCHAERRWVRNKQQLSRLLPSIHSKQPFEGNVTDINYLINKYLKSSTNKLDTLAFPWFLFFFGHAIYKKKKTFRAYVRE